MGNLKLIEKAKESALSGRVLDRTDIIRLLGIDPESKDCDLLGKAAREAASVICGDRAYLWTAIGLDYKACPMNCDYCSLGEKWGIVTEEKEYTGDEILQMVKQYAEEGVRWIVLRTTQHYSLDRIINMSGVIKRSVAGVYELGLNVGEFDEDLARRMNSAGLEFVYHTLRLREGIDTRFDPADRLATLKAVSRSSLNLVSLVEPLGIEHTDEEIADNFLTAMKYGATVTGCMARIPVAGTPLGKYPAVSDRRLAQVIAVTRLAAGYNAPDICVHRATELAMEWGANVAVVETGAIPRDACCSPGSEWMGFDTATAKKWFDSKGYRVFSEAAEPSKALPFAL